MRRQYLSNHSSTFDCGLWSGPAAPGPDGFRRAATCAICELHAEAGFASRAWTVLKRSPSSSAGARSQSGRRRGCSLCVGAWDGRGSSDRWRPRLDRERTTVSRSRSRIVPERRRARLSRCWRYSARRRCGWLCLPTPAPRLSSSATRCGCCARDKRRVRNRPARFELRNPLHVHGRIPPRKKDQDAADPVTLACW